MIDNSIVILSDATKRDDIGKKGVRIVPVFSYEMIPLFRRLNMREV